MSAPRPPRYRKLPDQRTLTSHWYALEQDTGRQDLGCDRRSNQAQRQAPPDPFESIDRLRVGRGRSEQGLCRRAIPERGRLIPDPCRQRGDLRRGTLGREAEGPAQHRRLSAMEEAGGISEEP